MNINALSNGKGGATKAENRFGSPLFLVNHLQRYFGRFTCDLAAEPWSAVASGFITKEMDLFKQLQLRVKHGYINFEYGPGQLKRATEFVRDRVTQGWFEQVTQLVPHYTADGWWRNMTAPKGRVLRAEWRYDWLGHPRLKNWTRLFSEGLTVDVITVDGRLKHRYPPGYKGKRSIAPFSSAVVRFSQP